MKVYNMEGKTGRAVPNQHIVTDETGDVEYFQSYNTVIGRRTISTGRIHLDVNAWDYSVTTSRYRNQWLGEDTKTVKAKIKSGEYTLIDLNT